jgi:hypothetical protein
VVLGYCSGTLTGPFGPLLVSGMALSLMNAAGYQTPRQPYHAGVPMATPQTGPGAWMAPQLALPAAPPQQTSAVWTPQQLALYQFQQMQNAAPHLALPLPQSSSILPPQPPTPSLSPLAHQAQAKSGRGRSSVASGVAPTASSSSGSAASSSSSGSQTPAGLTPAMDMQQLALWMQSQRTTLSRKQRQRLLQSHFS